MRGVQIDFETAKGYFAALLLNNAAGAWVTAENDVRLEVDPVRIGAR